MPELSRRRSPARAGHLLHEPADRRPGRHDRQRRAARRSQRDLRRVGLRAAVDDRRLHAGAREPADAGRARPPTASAARGSSRSAWRCSPLGSLLCSLAPSLGWLIAFRVLQAVGGAMLNPVAMSIIRNTFEDPRERAQAIGVWGGVVGISMALGPVLGGVLVGPIAGGRSSWSTSRSAWRRSSLTARFVPESRAPRPRRPDPVGQVLVIVAAGRADLRDHRGPRPGLGLAVDRRPLRVAAASRWSALLALRAAPRRPLIELRFFRSAPFSGGDRHRGRGVRGARRLPVPQHALPAGRARPLAAARRPVHAADGGDDRRLCAPLVRAASSARAGRAARWWSAGSASTVGGRCCSRLDADTSVALAARRVRASSASASASSTRRSPTPPCRACRGRRPGVAAAVASTSRQIGQSLGVAVIGAVATSALAWPDARRLRARQPAGWWIVAACGAIVLILGIITTGPWARRTAARTAARLEAGGTPPARSEVAVP